MHSPLLSDGPLLAQNVPPKAGTPGAPSVAVDGSGSPAPAAQQSPLAGAMPLLMMAAIFVPLFLLMSRRQKKEATARASLKKGDRVMTNAGLIGELVEMDDRLAKVKIAPSVTVQFMANTVTPFVEPAPNKELPKDLKDAKALPEKK